MKIGLFRLALVLTVGIHLGACSSEDNEFTEHVWKDQVEAVDKAREVEGMIQDAARTQKKAAEESSY